MAQQGIGQTGPSWTIRASSGSHELLIKPGLTRRHTIIELDGREVARMGYPDYRQPWVETALNVAGHQVIAASQWHPGSAWLPTAQVFVDGSSLQDGRSIESHRESAARPVTWYAHSFGDGQGRNPPLLRPRGAIALGLVLSSPFLVLVVQHPWPDLLLWLGALLVITTYLFGIGWLNGRLLRMPAWSSAVRLVILITWSLVVPFLVVWVISVLQTPQR